LLAQIVQLKARIAGNIGTIGKIRNAEMGDLRRKVMFHELNRGSLMLIHTWLSHLGMLRWHTT